MHNEMTQLMTIKRTSTAELRLAATLRRAASGRPVFVSRDPPSSAQGGSRQISLRLAEVGARLAEQEARRDQQLDLLGALEDVEDLRVAGPLLEQ